MIKTHRGGLDWLPLKGVHCVSVSTQRSVLRRHFARNKCFIYILKNCGRVLLPLKRYKCKQQPVSNDAAIPKYTYCLYLCSVCFRQKHWMGFSTCALVFIKAAVNPFIFECEEGFFFPHSAILSKSWCHLIIPGSASLHVISADALFPYFASACTARRRLLTSSRRQSRLPRT